jgi:hypothetical protein
MGRVATTNYAMADPKGRSTAILVSIHGLTRLECRPALATVRTNSVPSKSIIPPALGVMPRGNVIRFQRCR